MSDWEKARDEAAAHYQISKPDFCGVSLEEKAAFDAGANWARDYLSKNLPEKKNVYVNDFPTPLMAYDTDEIEKLLGKGEE